MDTEGFRHAEVTEFDRGALIQIPAWFLMVVLILVTFLKLAIRFKATHNPGADDALCFLAMLLGVGGTVAVSLAVNDGLGRSATVRDHLHFADLQKDIYASSILYVLTLTVAKIAALTFITRLAVSHVHLIVLWASIGLVTLWGLAAVFAFAFQCGLSHPWNSGRTQCFDPLPFWNVIGGIDIFTDLLTILIPQWLVWKLQMSKAKKMIVLVAFSSRIVVIVAAITRLLYLKQLESSTDYLFDYVAFATCTQCQIALSVIVTCLPSLKPFIDRTTSGMLNVSIAPRSGTTYGLSSHNNYRLEQLSKAKRDESERLASKSVDEAKDYSRTEIFRPERVKHKVVITSGNGQPQEDRRDDSTSLESTGSEKMFVRLQTDLSIQYSDGPPLHDKAFYGSNPEHAHQDAVHAQFHV